MELNRTRKYFLEEYTGNDLINLFNEHGIFTKNLDNVINGWFDTDSKTEKEFLTWLCMSLTKEEYLSKSEIKMYEYLCNNEMLFETTYEAELTVVKEKYPNILELEENMFDVQIMEDELEMHTKQLQQLENILNMHERINESICKDFVKVENTKMNVIHEHQQTYNDCLKKYEMLEKCNTKLEETLCKYKQNKFDCVQINQSINMRDSCEIFKNAQSILTENLLNKDLKKIENYLNKQLKKIETIEERIIVSSKECFLNESEKNKLNAVLNYLKSCNLDEFINMNTSCINQMKINNTDKQEDIAAMSGKLMSWFKKESLPLVYSKKAETMEVYFDVCKKWMQHLHVVKQNLQNCLNSQILFEELISKEIFNLEDVKELLKNIHSRINKGLHVSYLEKSSINNSTISVETDFFRFVNSILSDEKNDISGDRILNLVSAFNVKQNTLECQLYDESVKSYCNSHKSLTLKNEIKIMQKRLKNGPSSQLIIIPSKYIEVLNEIDIILKTKKNAIMQAARIQNETKKKLHDPLLNLKRHLWIYFLTEPEKVLPTIEKIKMSNNAFSK